MANRDHGRRIDRLEARIQNLRCMTCYGHAFAIVFVPNEGDEDKPEWNPTHCSECGIPLRTVRKIIGISREEMYPESVGSVR